METTVAYRQIVMEALQEHAEFRNRADQDGIVAQLLFDKERDQYMIVDAGWLRYKRIRTIVVFVRIVEGKIWVEEDWTEYGIANEFVARGVPHHDIVLGFKHPEVRPLTDFAVA